MGQLGQAEFKSLEAAVRDRLTTWTAADESLRFAVLDLPSTLDRLLSNQLLESEMNEDLDVADPGKVRMDYLYSLDKVANVVLAGQDTVTPSTETIGDIYGDILKFGQPLPRKLSPAEEAELEQQRAVLYELNPDTGLLDTTPALQLYQQLSQEVMRLSIELAEAQDTHGRDSAEARMKAQELSFAETDLLVRGQKNRIEEAQARIRTLSTNSGELWQRALLDYEDSLLMDAETTEQFPASRCPQVPDENWMQIDLDMRGNSTGAVLGLDEQLLRLRAEIFLLPIDRSGWMQAGVLTRIPWTWGVLGRSGKLSDGAGGGAMPYLPQHMVLMRNIRLTVQIPFEGGSEPPKAGLPKIGRMVLPLKVEAVDGRRVETIKSVATVQSVQSLRATTDKSQKSGEAPKRGATLSQMRVSQMLTQRQSGRTLVAQLSALQGTQARVARPAAPKVSRARVVRPVAQATPQARVRAAPAQTTVRRAAPAAAVRPSVQGVRVRPAKPAAGPTATVTARPSGKPRGRGGKGIAGMMGRHAEQLRQAAEAARREAERKAREDEARRKAEERRRREEEARRRRAEEEARRRAEEEARRKAPSEVALAVHALVDEAWTPREVGLSIRGPGNRVTTARTNASGEARLRLAPGSYTAQIVQGVDADEVVEPLNFTCQMGEPVSDVLPILPRWKKVELTACEEGEEVLLFGYLLRMLPELPQVVSEAEVDREAPDLVG